MGIAAISSKLHEAGWREVLPNRKLHGYLCPRHGEIGEGLAGFCFICQNIGARLYNLGDAQPAVVMQVDPNEKKPLNHFLPDTKVFLLALWSDHRPSSPHRHVVESEPKQTAVRSPCGNPVLFKIGPLHKRLDATKPGWAIACQRWPGVC
jgi:hypothetical protein